MKCLQVGRAHPRAACGVALVAKDAQPRSHALTPTFSTLFCLPGEGALAFAVSLSSLTHCVRRAPQNIVARVEHKPWRRVLLFCDNAGADVMGMLLLARALVRVGDDDCVAVLVANSTPGTLPLQASRRVS